MKNTKRIGRVEGVIKRNLAAIIQQDFRDTRLQGIVTLSDVTISRDLSHAKVYFTVLNGDPVETEEILNSSAPFLRGLLAKTLTTRTVPSLHFIFDQSIEYGKKLSKIIDDVNLDNDQESDDSEEL